jgi:hypothetical protein
MSSKVKRVSLGAIVLSTSIAIGVVGLGGATATASAKSHTLNFVAVATSLSTPTRSGAFYESYVAVGSESTTDGVLSCVASATSWACDAAGADASGILDSHFTISLTTGVLTGTVTGGTRGYANATGTVSGKEVPAGEGITVVYTT